MRLRIIKEIKKSLKIPAARDAFVEIVEMRQRLFEMQFANTLCLDRYDLIADHVVAYEDSEFKRPFAYMRSLTPAICERHGVPFPILSAVEGSPEHVSAFRRFAAEVPVPVTFGYLCVESRYRHEFEGIKPVDLLSWACYQASGAPHEQLGLCCTINAKYHHSSWYAKMGAKVEGLAQFIHPVVPLPHELVLVPSIQRAYWDEHEQRFGRYIADAQWIVPEAVTVKKAA